MIALDAMGGDHAPNVTVRGAIEAAKGGVPILLCGDEAQLHQLLGEFFADWRSLPLTIEHCTQAIGMAEEPVRSVLRKQDASLVKAVKAVALGQAAVAVTAGNSGAALAAGSLYLKCMPGIERPALGAFLPTRAGSVFCLDLGATTDCKPVYLEQFALMGSVYVQQVLGIPNPRIGLLANGHEPYKGSSAVKKAFALLERRLDINFIGNIEARDIFEGRVDVLVCDGFVGNIMLKTVQGAMREFFAITQEVVQASWWHKVLYLLGGSAIMEKLKKAGNYRDREGALMLGLQQPLIVTHGCASARAIEHALNWAHTIMQKQFTQQFNNNVLDLIKASPHHYDAAFEGSPMLLHQEVE